MPRGRKRAATSATPAAPSSALSLIEALKFVTFAQKEIGESYETHCVFFEKWAYATNGILSAGHPIVEDLQACPHTKTLLNALSKCADSISVAKLDTERLSVTSGKLNVKVPCVNISEIPHIFPDPRIVGLDERITKALSIVSKHASEGAQTVLQASVWLRPQSAVATDRHIVVEAFHGTDLPPQGLTIPKASVKALLSCGKKLEGFGYSWDEDGTPRSATFYFEGGSWIKTQLYKEQWPDVDGLFNKFTPQFWPVPATFKQAVETTAPFSKDQWLHFRDNKVCSDFDPEKGASFECDGLPKLKTFNAEYLKCVADLATSIDFGTNATTPLLFIGESLRGMVASCNPTGEDENDDKAADAADAGGWNASQAAPAIAETTAQAGTAASAPAGFSVAGNVPLPPG